MGFVREALCRLTKGIIDDSLVAVPEKSTAQENFIGSTDKGGLDSNIGPTQFCLPALPGPLLLRHI